jgi:hypothetical protein
LGHLIKELANAGLRQCKEHGGLLRWSARLSVPTIAVFGAIAGALKQSLWFYA